MNDTKHDIPVFGGAQRLARIPDIRRSVTWRSWDAGCDEATRRQVPMVVVAEPYWSNSAQRLAYVVGNDPRLRDALESQVVPVLVEPEERPDLASRWRWEAVVSSGSCGPPLLMFLTHETTPILNYGAMTYEGDERIPSLASLITSMAEQYASHPETFLAEARAAQSVTQSGETPEEYWNQVGTNLDRTRGGLDELPRHPHPQLLLSALAVGDAAHQQWVETTLNRMIDGGLNDQLDRGVHRCARDASWAVPHFEKPVPLNAQLVAVFAWAAAMRGNSAWEAMAQDLAGFCVDALRDDIDCVASDSFYYTWTSKEVLDILPPAVVQPVSLHYGITPGGRRLALRRAVSMDHMHRYSREAPHVLESGIEGGRLQLLKHRRLRPAPPVLAMPGYAWRAETLRWLMVASRWLPDIEVGRLESLLATLVRNGPDPERGYLRDESGHAWLEDQASLIAAMVQASAHQRDLDWIPYARELADILIRTYARDDGWCTSPGADSLSVALVDDILPAAVPTLTSSLVRLGEDYASAALSLSQRYSSLVTPIGARGASWWRTVTAGLD